MNYPKIFVTSFTNFYDESFINGYGLPFRDVEEMNRCIIKNWNAAVEPNDTVYHLGKFSNCSLEDTKRLVFSLHGNIILLETRGNALIYDALYCGFCATFSSLSLEFDGLNMVMQESVYWEKSEQDLPNTAYIVQSIVDNKKFEGNCFNASCHLWNFCPVELRDVSRKFKQYKNRKRKDYE